MDLISAGWYVCGFNAPSNSCMHMQEYGPGFISQHSFFLLQSARLDQRLSFLYLVGCWRGDASSSVIVGRAFSYTCFERSWNFDAPHCRYWGFLCCKSYDLTAPTRPSLLLINCTTWTHLLHDSDTPFLRFVTLSAWQHLPSSLGLIERRYIE